MTTTQCHQCAETRDIEACITCGTPVCKTHAGSFKTYIGINSRKGRACTGCIEQGLAFPELGVMDAATVVQGLSQRLELRLYPQIMRDITELTDATKQETFEEARRLVRELEESIQRSGEILTGDLEQSADRLITETLAKTQATLQTLTAEITNAITHQRVEVKSDADRILQEISKTTHEAITGISVAINQALLRATVLLLAGLGGIAVILSLILKH